MALLRRRRSGLESGAVIGVVDMHLTVEFQQGPALHYRAEKFAAEEFASEMTRWGSAVVTLDENVTPGLRKLPCWELFLP